MIRSNHVTGEDVRSKNKPDAAVIILRKVASHLNYFNTVHLLDVVAHLEALFHAVVCFVARSYHRYLIAIRAEVVFNLTYTSLFIADRRSGSKLNYYWLTYTCF